MQFVDEPIDFRTETPCDCLDDVLNAYGNFYERLDTTQIKSSHKRKVLNRIERIRRVLNDKGNCPLILD
jgi:hypothetical protein